MVKINPKLAHVCAFCARWYDPANSHISPCKPYNGTFWEYDKNSTAPCFEKAKETRADEMCSKYVPKKLL